MLVGHTVVTRCKGLDEVKPFVFVNPSTSQPLKAAEVSRLWCRTVLHRYNVHFGPQMCRSIFVHERRGGERAVGPDDEEAAMLMGHSVKAWDKTYDKNFQPRRAQAAVDNMDGWRDAMIARASGGEGPQQQQQQQHQQLGELQRRQHGQQQQGQQLQHLEDEEEDSEQEDEWEDE